MVEIKFDEISKSLGIPESALVKFYNRKVGFLVDGGMELEKAKEIAYNQIIAQLRKDLSSTTHYTDFTLVPLGLSQTFDTTKSLVNRCLEEAQKDKTQAITKGFIAPDGTPLDFRKTFSSGAENFNYGKPLPVPPESLSRLVVTVAKSKEGGKEELAIIRLRGSVTQSEIIPFNVYSANLISLGSQGQDQNGIMLLSSGQTTTFTPLGKKLEAKQLKDDKLLKKFKIKLNEVEDWHEKNKDNFNRFFIMEADYAMLLNPNSPAPNYKILLKDFDSDFEGNYIGVVPREMIENIGVGSRLLIVSSTMEAEDGIRIMVMGLLPIEVISPDANPKEVEKLEEKTPTPTDEWKLSPEDLEAFM